MGVFLRLSALGLVDDLGCGAFDDALGVQIVSLLEPPRGAGVQSLEGLGFRV